MPFLVWPTSRPPPALDALACRLCPYTGPLREVLPGVWGTSLVVGEEGRASNALRGGTAAFEIRAEGAALVVRTDPLGICPIWYARAPGGWAVSPEAKALAALLPVTPKADAELLAVGPRVADWSPFEDVRRLPPGCELRLSGGRAEVAGTPRRFELVRSERDEDWPTRLLAVLEGALAPAAGPTAACVSGGIDSSVACALARRQGPVRSFTLGTVHGNEFADARALADGLGTAHHEVLLAAAAVREELERVVFRNEVFDGLTAEILLQLSALYEAARAGCARVVTGFGSDLLFDGMLRHAAYMEAVGLGTTAQLLERTRWTGELAPFVHWSRGLAAAHVFWDPAVIELATQVPRALCFVDGVEKRVLREAATRGGLLPRHLAFRPKTGLSDGTGANRLVSEALGLDGPHAYPEKSRWCLARFKRLFRAAPPTAGPSAPAPPGSTAA